MRSKKAFYNVISNLILQFFIFAYGFILPKIIMSNYGSNVNGLISSITQFLAYISLLESGVGPVVKSRLYKPIADKNTNEIRNILYATDKFFKKIAFIFIAYILILLLFYPKMISLNNSTLYVSSLIIIISVSIFCEYFFGMVYSIFLQANQETYVISVIQIGTYFLAIIIALFMAKKEVSVHTLKLGTSLIFVLRPIIQNLYVKRKYNIKLADANKDYVLKDKWDGLAQHIAYVIHTNTDITILSIFSTLSEVSVYSVYMLIVKGVKALISSFSSGLDAAFGDMISKKEIENLRIKFEMYEIVYFIICSILFSCSLVLIVPFVEIYTQNIHDANYIRPIFAILLVISECIWSVRLPYLTLAYANGDFRQTRVGAWVECLSNIIISLILVKRFGIVGVAIGTIIAMVIRTIEFMYHSNKRILKVDTFNSMKKIMLMSFIILMVSLLSNYFNLCSADNYLNWLIKAIVVFTLTTIITIILNIIVYNEKIIKIFKLASSTILRKLKK